MNMQSVLNKEPCLIYNIPVTCVNRDKEFIVTCIYIHSHRENVPEITTCEKRHKLECSRLQKLRHIFQDVDIVNIFLD